MTQNSSLNQVADEAGEPNRRPAAATHSSATSVPYQSRTSPKNAPRLIANNNTADASRYRPGKTAKDPVHFDTKPLRPFGF